MVAANMKIHEYQKLINMKQIAQQMEQNVGIRIRPSYDPHMLEFFGDGNRKR